MVPLAVVAFLALLKYLIEGAGYYYPIDFIYGLPALPAPISIVSE